MDERRQILRGRFAALAADAEEKIDLAEAALLIAAVNYPGLESSLYVDALNDFGEACRSRAGNSSDASSAISAINRTLFDDLGFRGNTENYYDPRNSFLNDVIDRRAGIPITLSLVYMEVARRIGLAVHGVGMPGHFLIGCLQDGCETFIDPFNSGKVMDADGCSRMIATMSGNKTNLLPEHLAAVTKKQILTRILANLFSIYLASKSHNQALEVVDWILILNPDSPIHTRDRGLLLAALGETSEALRALDRYLHLLPSAQDSQLIRGQIGALRRLQAQNN